MLYTKGCKETRYKQVTQVIIPIGLWKWGRGFFKFVLVGYFLQFCESIYLSLFLSGLFLFHVSVASVFSVTFSLRLTNTNFILTTVYFCLYQVQVQSSEEQSSDIFQVGHKYPMYKYIKLLLPKAIFSSEHASRHLHEHAAQYLREHAA